MCRFSLLLLLLLLIIVLHYSRSWVSSGSIVSDYGLDDRATGVRSLAGARDFSSIICVQTGSGAHSASCPMGTGGPFPWGKARPGRDADHPPPSGAIHPLSPSAFMACSGTSLLLLRYSRRIFKCDNGLNICKVCDVCRNIIRCWFDEL
jgi:hypothetical protein